MSIPTTDPPAECSCYAKASRFLSHYCAELFGSGATCLRLEMNASRIARRFGMTIDITILPRHLMLTFRSGEKTRTEVVTVPPRPISYNINTRLSQLSWEVSDNNLPIDDCEMRFAEIMTQEKQHPWLVLLLASIANASFCRLFGGDWIAMAIVAVATLAGYYTKQILVGYRMDPRAIFVICGFISTVIASAATLFNLGTTPMIAIGSSVLYLVPGIPFLNSFSDLLNRHYICAFSRFADACVLTACLSSGLGLGLVLMRLGMP